MGHSKLYTVTKIAYIPKTSLYSVLVFIMDTFASNEYNYYIYIVDIPRFGNRLFLSLAYGLTNVIDECTVA